MSRGRQTKGTDFPDDPRLIRRAINRNIPLFSLSCSKAFGTRACALIVLLRVTAPVPVNVRLSTGIIIVELYLARRVVLSEVGVLLVLDEHGV